MINHLKLTNFRAFKDQTFHFRKLNIFIGKNNSGKSSALSAINVLAQTIKEEELDGTPIVLNGPYANLGTYIDVVNGNHPRRKLGIEFGYDGFSVKADFKYRTQRRQIELIAFELADKGRSVMRYAQKKDAYDLFVQGDSYEKLFPEVTKRRPRFRNFWPSRVSTINHVVDDRLRSSAAYGRLRDAERALFTAKQRLDSHFNNFDAISPFRDQPQRTYLYSGETARQIGMSGSNAATMLAADSAKRGAQKKNLVESISEWFRYTGIAQGLSVVSLTPRHFELCLISNDGSTHNICDVGFGCSQVLPVLTAGLNLFSKDSGRVSSKVLVVQEPEIHLHPNAQAAMGSFFVSLIRDGGQAFVETHSDNLVLRIARHVALGDINPDDVAIFYISDAGDQRVTEISITETGSFQPDWPEGFFPQRQTESLLLARAAMKRNTDEVGRQLDFRYPEAR